MELDGNRTHLKLGARGSLLSRSQSGQVAAAMEERWPGLKVELVIVRTSGDTIQDRPLHEFGGKGLFTKELEQTLLAGEVDFAVHSFKDVPVTMPLVAQDDLVIAGVPPRADPRDLLVSARARSLAGLPAGARVGTGSLRRQAQVLRARPDVQVLPIRGNVDTRLGKLRSGDYDAVVLALAGVRRAGLFDEALMTPLEVDVCLPAAGQGALALQCRRDDAYVRGLLSDLGDPTTRACVELERQVVELLQGDCHSPIAALATMEGGVVRLRALVAARDGRPPVIAAEASAAIADAERVVERVVQALEAQDARRLLHGG
jgi:hydroxymethylbilane synthase